MMVSCRSDRAEQVKDRLTMDEVARRYGFEPNRVGFMHCPFHQGDHTASLKIYPGQGGFHCFGCGAGGSVIDFVMQLYDLTFAQAVVRLNADFGLELSAGRSDPAARSRIIRARAKEARELAEYRREYQSRTTLYREMWQALQAGEDTPLYFAALRELPILDYWFDEHPYK